METPQRGIPNNRLTKGTVNSPTIVFMAEISLKQEEMETEKQCKILFFPCIRARCEDYILAFVISNYK